MIYDYMVSKVKDKTSSKIHSAPDDYKTYCSKEIDDNWVIHGHISPFPDKNFNLPNVNCSKCIDEEEKEKIKLIKEADPEFEENHGTFIVEL